jgi:hypothetical protein
VIVGFINKVVAVIVAVVVVGFRNRYYIWWELIVYYCWILFYLDLIGNFVW